MSKKSDFGGLELLDRQIMMFNIIVASLLTCTVLSWAATGWVIYSLSLQFKAKTLSECSVILAGKSPLLLFTGVVTTFCSLQCSRCWAQLKHYHAERIILARRCGTEGFTGRGAPPTAPGRNLEASLRESKEPPEQKEEVTKEMGQVEKQKLKILLTDLIKEFGNPERKIHNREKKDPDNPM
ncbi:hypothetical protein Q4E93_20965 [Flavitalea sp. BT771]|uniref:hypothetical protein n=1 Tax=Flavitalea sp. BT771 TaxID=3063329 RepID=UPI0026E43F74|nr:hypothetical protein [Flavitalea sp. BT771]MDO6433093.1 hypothetical protein [Flavitalea sp. BT771]MDV6221631.1 hypothetical protein [Flavitalea sp. BT771]